MGSQESIGRSFDVIAVSDNIVLRSGPLLVKVARHYDGRSRLMAGLHGAIVAERAGAPAVQPIHKNIINTTSGPASFWPWVDHRGTTPNDITLERSFQLGEALAHLQDVPIKKDSQWDPFARVPQRIATTAFGKATQNRCHTLVAAVRPHVPFVTKWRFAHGDASVSNMLDTSEEVLLIDFDSCGPRPEGWDLACLFVELALEHCRQDAFAKVLEGWDFVGATPRQWESWALVKDTMATTFILTLPPTDDLNALIHTRLTQLEEWVTTGRKPLTLASTAT